MLSLKLNVCRQPISLTDREKDLSLLLGGETQPSGQCNGRLLQRSPQSMILGMCYSVVVACRNSSREWPSFAQGLKRGRQLRPRLYLVNCPSMWKWAEGGVPKFRFSHLCSHRNHLKNDAKWVVGCVCVCVCVCVCETDRHTEKERERDREIERWKGNHWLKWSHLEVVDEILHDRTVMVLNQGRFCPIPSLPPGYICQCLETFLLLFLETCT